MTRVEAILAFWFGVEPAIAAERQQLWFAADPAFDRLCEQHFMADHGAAAEGRLDDWQTERSSCLALMLLLDQFPRNLFRGFPRVFATDERALAAARHAIANGFDRATLPTRRAFFHLPFEHSEKLADQDDSVRLTRTLANEAPACAIFLKFAELHRDVIRRFGRFPHRNAILGRTSTAVEASFLRDHPALF